eukprot:TRINITY_DN37358_c0_g1_i1.p1 TRINITY_DN37358_c0_g1~~TRINITY_DN37358_c0_g1_i1.p1  ORF type:complete len:236 (+),score=63.55 TRINITY_DN37358_c0_g1_i1:83-790(+)
MTAQAAADGAAAEQDALPCFGGAVVEEEPPPPMPYGSDDDSDTASVDSHDEITVYDAPVACPVAGEVNRDSGDVLLEADADAPLDEALADEVSPAVDFLMQLPRKDAMAVLQLLRSGENADSSGHGEAVKFVRILLDHLQDKAAAFTALQRGLLGSKSSIQASSRVSAFLKKRRQHRTAKVRVRGNWEEHFTRGDEKSAMRRYFYNNATQRTQWDVPPEFEDVGEIIEEGDEIDF